MASDTRVCVRCRQELPLTREFFGHVKASGQHRSICRKCESKRVLEYKKANRDVDNLLSRERQQRTNHWRPSSELKQSLFDEQKGCCALCGGQINGWEAAKAAVVYGRDGKPLPVEEVSTTAEVDPGPVPSEARRPSFSINIERQATKVGKPTIDRANPDLDSVGRLQEEANRVQAEALQEKHRQAAEAFLRTLQGQRIVALEQALAGALERLSALEAKPTRTTNAKAKTDGN